MPFILFSYTNRQGLTPFSHKNMDRKEAVSYMFLEFKRIIEIYSEIHINLYNK